MHGWMGMSEMVDLLWLAKIIPTDYSLQLLFSFQLCLQYGDE